MKKLKKILIIISITIFILGMIIGLSISNELVNSIPNEQFIIDGSDFSGLIQVTGTIGSKILGTIIIFASFFIDTIIWIMYGIVWIIFKMKHNKKNY